jgi:hypothetical protein
MTALSMLLEKPCAGNFGGVDLSSLRAFGPNRHPGVRSGACCPESFWVSDQWEGEGWSLSLPCTD